MSDIFYSTRSFLGREGKSILRHLSIMAKDVDLLSNVKTDSVKEHLVKYGNVKVNRSLNLFGNFYETTAVNMNTWMDIYEALNVSNFQSYNRLIIMGGMDLWRSELTRFGKRSGGFPKDSGQIKFRSVGVHCLNILALLKAHNLYGIPLHELAFDPNEISVNLFHKDVAPKNDYYLYHGYDIPKYNILRLDSLQHYFLSRTNKMFSRDKIVDFTFGYTILEKSNREEFKEDIKNMISQFETYNLYVKDYQTGEDTTVDSDLYLDKIEESRFTYMLPSYDRHCFSGYRFIEALHHDCLPLIHPACNVTDIQKSYNVNLSELITQTPPSESRRLELLEYLKSNIMIVEKDFR